MFVQFFLSLSRAVPHGAFIALVAFPAGLVAAAIWVVLFFGLAFLLLIPFLPAIVAFLLSLAVWVLAARLAGRLAGLEALSPKIGYLAGYRRAFPLAMLFKLLTALVGWTISVVTVSDAGAGLPEAFRENAAAFAEQATPVWSMLSSVIMAMIVLPSANGLRVRSAAPYGARAVLLRLLIAVPVVALLTWLAAQPLVVLITQAVSMVDLTRVFEADTAPTLELLSVPVFYAGALIWLSAAMFLAFEAHFVGRLEALYLADRFESLSPQEVESDIRALRRARNTDG